MKLIEVNSRHVHMGEVFGLRHSDVQNRNLSKALIDIDSWLIHC